MCGILFLVFLLFNLFLLHQGTDVQNITSLQPLLQGQTLTSPSQDFELGFFGRNNSSYEYMGIWYKNIVPRIVVWVANREKPVTSSPASLTIGSDGNLRLVDGRQNTIWSTDISAPSNGSIAMLLDSGSFVLKVSVAAETTWDSFDHPSDTVLPGTKMYFSVKTGEKSVLTSWKTDNDPSLGNFHLGIAPQTPPQAFIWNGSKPYWRSGQWAKSKFLGLPEMDASYINAFSLIENVEQQNGYFTANIYNSSILAYMVISPAGILKVIYWNKGTDSRSNWTIPYCQCDIYGACGPNGVCEKSDPLICKCKKGFIPQSNEEWSKGNWTGGCKRQTKLLCQTQRNTGAVAVQERKADGFWREKNLKPPDFSEHLMFENASGCYFRCLNNCSCMAYAFVAGIGCLVWAGDLMDMQELSFGGQDLFIRLAHSELVGERQQGRLVIIILSTMFSISALCAIVFGLRKWRANNKVRKRGTIGSLRHTSLQHIKGGDMQEQDLLELPVFEFDSIVMATNNFSTTNKLGQGGFGPVYQGKLENGKDVAIKRLSSNSGQGTEEFKNEIVFISKLQHRNLVKLLGCCIEKEEKILIYEFMPNKSLDTFLFDPTKRSELDWAKRFNIIQCVARGLLYLHRDSSLRIIHRDLKVSNILLDEKMNAKISDFGLARMFQGSQNFANTHRVVGTLGYMSPEYALSGIFSEKSDVFSFGILLLEIVSGKKNNSFCNGYQHLSLTSYAWKLWSENRALDFMDEALADSFSSSEVIRCVQIGLLCVQGRVEDRPTMSAVVSMFSREAMLPQPKELIFTFQSMLTNNIQPEEACVCSNEVTLSMIKGR